MTRETHRIRVAETQSVVVDWYPTGEGAHAAVFVHGRGSHRRGEKAVYFAERFNAQGWSFAAVDLRGHGDSDGTMRDLTRSSMLADLDAVLDWLAGRSVTSHPVLIGSSVGGAVIAWYALEHAREVGSLPMIGPSLLFPSSLAAQLRSAAVEECKRVGRRTWKNDWIDLEIRFRLADDALECDPQKLLSGFQSRTLILHGMRDDAVDWR